jgi:hypothetical protein
MDVPNASKSVTKSRSGTEDKISKPEPAGTQAGIWITLVGAIISISALEHLTRWPWYVTYPLALIAGLAITAGYLKLKQFVFGNPK